MGILETVKDVAVLVQKADNVELLKKVLDLQTELIELTQEMATLRRELSDATDQLQFQGELRFRDNLYWRVTEGGEEGPFCSRCWDSDRKAIRMHRREEEKLQCPSCKVYPPGHHPAISTTIVRG